MGGIVLIAAAALAMLFANLEGTAHAYQELLHWQTGPVISPKYGPMSVHLWINDALMAVFFLLVGLEIKREFMVGKLAKWSDRRLPVAAAGAGMMMPALVYLGVLYLTGYDPSLVNGWAIPAATDIAFAIGVLAILGRHAPASLKLFLTTVAIVDDMGAVVIIALVYTSGLSSLALAAAAVILVVMYGMNKSGVVRLWPYMLLGLGLWYFIFLSGVHATIAGVLTAMMVPMQPGKAGGEAPLVRLEHGLHKWVAFVIVPLFGFANAGVALGGQGWGVLGDTLPLAIALGLLIGKQAGIFSAIWIAVKIGFAERPGGASWRQIYGVSLLAGIGFTMSLFIGGLAFPGREELVDEVKIGVLAGSILSALAGFLVLRLGKVNTIDDDALLDD